MEEKEIATRFLRKINSDNNLVVIDCSVSSFDVDIGPIAENELNRARKLTCRFNSNGREASKRLILLQSDGRVPHKWIKSKVNAQTKIVPHLEEILSRVSADNCELAPQRFENKDAKNPYIIEDDLTFEKFKEVSDVGLGSLQIARYLAGFHAASIVMFRENPGMSDEFHSSINVDISEVIENVRKIANEIDSWSGRKWSQTLKNFLPDWEIRLKNAGELDELFVLNHGRPVWKNILMRYRGCGLWDVRFRDFENVVIQSPIYDLTYFIMSSVSKELRFKELDHTLKYYHASFVQFCSLLRVPVDLDFQQFRCDFKKRAALGFFVFCSYCGIESKNVDREHFLEGLEFFEQEGLFQM